LPCSLWVKLTSNSRRKSHYDAKKLEKFIINFFGVSELLLFIAYSNIRSVIIITFLNTFFKFQYHMLLHVLHSVFIEFNWLDFYILKLSCSNPQLENIHILKFNQVSINYFGFLLMSAFITIVSSLTLHSLWFNCSLSILFVILETKYSLLQNTSCLIQLKRCCLCIFYLIILYQ